MSPFEIIAALIATSMGIIIVCSWVLSLLTETVVETIDYINK